MEFLRSNTFTKNYMNYLQARQRSPSFHIYYGDKPPLSYLTNAKLTWMLKRLGSADWFNEELGGHGTPLINAAVRNDIEMINFLLDAGVDAHKPTDHHVLAGSTPLHLAANNSVWDAFDLLVHRGADINKPHAFTWETVLHQVCAHGRLDKVKRLLELGVAFDCKNYQGMTPLDFAIQGGSLEIVKLLVDTGAKIVERGSEMGSGKTAIHFSIELRNEAITEYLLERCDDLDRLHNLTLKQIQWAEGKPWFGRLRQAVESDSTGPDRQDNLRFFTALDVMRTRFILQHRLWLPPAVTAAILDYAEYWVRSACRRDELWVVDQDTPQLPYVQVLVPGWGGASPVRRVVFRTRSHDQGKSKKQFVGDSDYRVFLTHTHRLQ
jgi:hypothetical protein